jgi:hypothetical protein
MYPTGVSQITALLLNFMFPIFRAFVVKKSSSIHIAIQEMKRSAPVLNLTRNAQPVTRNPYDRSQGFGDGSGCRYFYGIANEKGIHAQGQCFAQWHAADNFQPQNATGIKHQRSENHCQHIGHHPWLGSMRYFAD